MPSVGRVIKENPLHGLETGKSVLDVGFGIASEALQITLSGLFRNMTQQNTQLVYIAGQEHLRDQSGARDPEAFRDVVEIISQLDRH
tara:strand:+ start:566 stop:826 length:261 start_codon:yes stop_codon:yes gene_type:complete